MREPGRYTKEQEEFEIEERVQRNLPEVLQEDYKLERSYPTEEPEGRAISTTERQEHWEREARRRTENFIKSHQYRLQETTEEELTMAAENSMDIGQTIANAIREALVTKDTNKKVRSRLPDTYNGERKTSVVENWLFAIETYQYAEDLGDNDTIKLAATLLVGEAATWWRHYVSNRSYPTEWDEFKAAITAEFKPANARKLALDQFASVRQLRSVQEYVNNFRNILLELPGLDEEIILDLCAWSQT